jgi:hypothetical protein
VYATVLIQYLLAGVAGCPVCADIRARCRATGNRAARLPHTENIRHLVTVVKMTSDELRTWLLTESSGRWRIS